MSFQCSEELSFPTKGGFRALGVARLEEHGIGCLSVGRRMSASPHALQAGLGVGNQAGSVEPRGAGTWESGSPGPRGHGLPWEDSDLAHTGAHHRTQQAELQDSNWGLPSPESSLHGPGLMGAGPLW